MWYNGAMDTVLIVMGVILAVILVGGIYAMATRHLREKPSLKPSTDANRGNALRVILTILVSAGLIVAMFAAYSYFTSL